MPQYLLNGTDAPEPGPSGRLVQLDDEHGSTIAEASSSGHPVRLDEHAPRVIEVISDDPMIVHVVEPVLVGALPTGSGHLLTESDLGDRIAELDSTGHVPPGQLRQNYHHSQIIASDVWPIVHELGYPPAGIVARESDGTIIEPADITWPNPATTLYLHFPGRLVSGQADVS